MDMINIDAVYIAAPQKIAASDSNMVVCCCSPIFFIFLDIFKMSKRFSMFSTLVGELLYTHIYIYI